VCVFFNQKPQIAATQKMTINHPQDARYHIPDPSSPVTGTGTGSRARSQDQNPDKVPGTPSPRLLSNTFNAWPNYEKRKAGTQTQKIYKKKKITKEKRWKWL